MKRVLIVALVLSLFLVPIAHAAAKPSQGEPTDPEVGGEPPADESGEPTDPESVDVLLEAARWAGLLSPIPGVVWIAQD